MTKKTSIGLSPNSSHENAGISSAVSINSGKLEIRYGSPSLTPLQTKEVSFLWKLTSFVESAGLEPATSSLQMKRSSQLNYDPID